MDLMKKGWFSEVSSLWPGQSFSLEVSKILHKTQSPYQDILVLETKSHGRALVLDGIIQCTEHDEFAYQEMISFLPLCVHDSPTKVLIVGGGDGGVARDVAKHPQVQNIFQVEIDQKVIDLSKDYLPFMAQGFQSDKIALHVGDGFEFMKNHKHEFDVIITDSSDPVGPAISLFEENYFALLKQALRPNGVICSQAGAVWAELDHVSSTMNLCRKHFPSVRYAVASVPTYPTGLIGFIVASLKKDHVLSEPKIMFTDKQLDEMDMRYYSSDMHRAAFVLPRFVQKKLYSKDV